MVSVSIRADDPGTPDAQALLQASHDLMESLFPSEANHFLSLDALRAPHIRFFVAKTDGSAVGCAALANRGAYGEIKSMFVAPAARGIGVAAQLLEELVDDARRQNLPMLRLETGSGLDAAHRLYHRHGFVPCGAFGDYEPHAPYSIYMERAL